MVYIPLDQPTTFRKRKRIELPRSPPTLIVTDSGDSWMINLFGVWVCSFAIIEGSDGVLIWQTNKCMRTYTLNFMLRLLSSDFMAN
ncbi:transmembrane protein, putative [Medicago truncatula]|uniref:Transmembrane protein, putative n=1 Tax=Medicago truncatula TaxID=3880 RepID=G7ZZ61_MEDTR|nr:transmembrane protein, putative [Medicago truncatula]